MNANTISDHALIRQSNFKEEKIIRRLHKGGYSLKSESRV